MAQTNGQTKGSSQPDASTRQNQRMHLDPLTNKELEAIEAFFDRFEIRGIGQPNMVICPKCNAWNRRHLVILEQ